MRRYWAGQGRMWRGLLALALLVIPMRFGAHDACGQRVAIGLYDDVNLQSVSVIPESRGYRVMLDGQVRPLPTGCRLYAERDNQQLTVLINGQPVGNYCHVIVLHDEPVSQVSIAIGAEDEARRIVDGNISLTVDFQRVMCLNLVDQECYVAGVVLAEVGGGQSEELYKAQALLVRTYLLAHRDRHLTEGFNLCDCVHCQAYKGSAWSNEKIRNATLATKGHVVVDKDGRMIASVFHANCGGQTASAEQIWLTSRSYLRGVSDPDCAGASGSLWSAAIPLSEWRRFLISKGIPASRFTPAQMAYRSLRRETLYSLPGGYGVPFRDLREFFNLRSAWFDVEVRMDMVYLRGRGYGHGIGMCQRGAMVKARKGYDALRILQAYFYGVSVVRAEEALPMVSLEEE